jgi:hypothetical protein
MTLEGQIEQKFKAEIERRILEYLATVNSDDKHGIRHRVYPGGYPVIGETDVVNALKRLERRGLVRVRPMRYSCYDAHSWELVK